MKTPTGLLPALVLAASSTLLAQTPAPVQPDAAKGSPREAELAKQITAIFDAFTDNAALFSRDGKKVIFLSNRDGLPQIYVSDADKPEGPATRLLSTTERMSAPTALADGKSLIYRSDRGADENWSLFRCGLDGSGLTELTPGDRMQRDAPFVPDGMPKTAFYSARAMSDTGSGVYSWT